jgi:small subunit ribosomal protein S20
MAPDEKGKQKKTPSALKRALQSQERKLANRSFRSRVLTAIRSFEAALKEQEGNVQDKLQLVYSLMDKGVKRGIYKANKANRTKSRLAIKIAG